MSVQSIYDAYPSYQNVTALFNELKLEGEYKVLKRQLHLWNKENIEDFRVYLREALRYFHRCPFVNLDVKTFLDLFELDSRFIIYKDHRDVNEANQIVFAMDNSGKCLSLKLDNNPVLFDVIEFIDIKNKI